MARILVIDDDRDLLQVLVGMIEGGGHAALPEIGGADVWEALRDGTFDVVVTDLSMPSLDGLAVARWLQKYRPGIPVIAVSGDLADLEDIDGKSPFAAAIEKPLRRAALLAAIDAVLGGQTGTAAGRLCLSQQHSQPNLRAARCPGRGFPSSPRRAITVALWWGLQALRAAAGANARRA